MTNILRLITRFSQGAKDHALEDVARVELSDGGDRVLELLGDRFLRARRNLNAEGLEDWNQFLDSFAFRRLVNTI